MNGAKSALGSITVVSGLITVLASLASIVGYTITPDDQAQLARLVESGLTIGTSVVTLVTGAAAIYGRVKATKEIVAVTPGGVTK